MSGAIKSPGAPFVTVYSGTTCIGWIIARGKLGHEAFDVDEKSLGIYPNQRDAADAVRKTAEGGAT